MGRVITCNGVPVLASGDYSPNPVSKHARLNETMGSDRANCGTASKIIRSFCNEYRNSDIRADNAALQRRLNAHFRLLEDEIEILKMEISRRNAFSAVSPNQVPVSSEVTKERL